MSQCLLDVNRHTCRIGLHKGIGSEVALLGVNHLGTQVAPRVQVVGTDVEAYVVHTNLLRKVGWQGIAKGDILQTDVRCVLDIVVVGCVARGVRQREAGCVILSPLA